MNRIETVDRGECARWRDFEHGTDFVGAATSRDAVHKPVASLRHERWMLRTTSTQETVEVKQVRIGLRAETLRAKHHGHEKQTDSSSAAKPRCGEMASVKTTGKRMGGSSARTRRHGDVLAER